MNFHQQLWGKELKMEATIHLGCIKDNIASWSEKMILPLFLELVWHHLEHCVQFWAPQHKKDKVVFSSRNNPEEDSKAGKRAGRQVLWGKAEDIWVLYSRKKEVKNWLSALYNFLRRKVEREMLYSAPL